MLSSKLSLEVLMLLMVYSSYSQETAGKTFKGNLTKSTVLVQVHFMMRRRAFCTWEFLSGFPKGCWVLWAGNNHCDLLSIYWMQGTLHRLSLCSQSTMHFPPNLSSQFKPALMCMANWLTVVFHIRQSPPCGLYWFLFPTVVPTLSSGPHTC
jgi:hypothetical protein